MTTTEATHARPSLFGAVVNMLIVAFVLLMGYLLWPFAVAQWNGSAPADQQPAAAPAFAYPTPAPRVVPPAIVQPAPVLVQSVTGGEAPQPVQFQPAPAPAPVQAENAPAAEPAPRPLIIVHQVSQDGAHQVITGSGACKVAKVAARCSK
jgi:hypothetical protein